MARYLKLCFAAVLVILASSALAEDVVTLDVDNFDTELEKNDFIVVEFYAPWCGHCKKLTPEWEKAAGVLKKEDPPIVLAKVDANDEKNRPLATKYGVRGFPTIKIFKKGGEPRDYQGPREADGIVSSLKREAGPASVHLTSADQAKEFVESGLVTVVGVFDDLQSEAAKNFTAVAEKLRADYLVAHTTDGSVLPEAGDAPSLKGAKVAVRVFKKFDDKFADYKGDKFSVEEVAEFVEESSLPLVVEMSKDPDMRPMLMKVFNAPEPKVLAFYDNAHKDSKDFVKVLTELANKFKSKLRFINGDAKENENALKYFGVEIEDAPVAIIHDAKNDKKYILDKTAPKAIAAWLADFEAGKLQPRVKSEPIPADNDGPVKVLVGKNFDELVTDSGKNVFIEFYAPWCGHCKSLAPIWEKLGEHYADDDTVVIAKMDATANDIPSKEFDVQGFPTLYFYTSTGKVVSYEGNRSEEDLKEFVEKNKVASGLAGVGERLKEAVEEIAETVTGAGASKDEL